MNKKTSEENALGAIDGTELVRVAKIGQNYKTTIADLATYVAAATSGLPSVLGANSNTSAHDINVTAGDSIIFGSGTPARVGSFKTDGANGLCYADYTGTPVIYFHYPAKAMAWIPAAEVTALVAASVVTYGLTVGYQYTPGNAINIYTASSGIFRIKAPSLAIDVNYTFPVREAATISTGQVLSVSGVSGSEIATDWVTPAAASITVGTTAINSGTSGRIAYNSAGVYQESANLFWDNANSQLKLLGVGSASLPTVAIGSADLGWFNPTANELGLTTGGAERFRFSSTAINSVTTGSFTMRRAAGAAATPTYAFNGTVNTGMWLNGTSLGFSVNGVNNFNITTGNVLQLNNPGNTFKYLITPGAIGADRTLNLPVITGTDTLACLALAQTFTAAKTFTGGLTVSTANATITDVNFVLSATTGTKFGTATTQKLSLWNATPIVQPTTAVAAATFVANTSAIANDTATFDGYTIGQVVKALRNIGILA